MLVQINEIIKEKQLKRTQALQLLLNRAAPQLKLNLSHSMNLEEGESYEVNEDPTLKVNETMSVSKPDASIKPQ